MGRVKDMYMLMRLSYDQAEDDLAEKKTTNVVESYKNIISLGLNPYLQRKRFICLMKRILTINST